MSMTEEIVVLSWEPEMSMGVSARMVMMRIWMRMKKHFKPMMDQCRMRTTHGIVLLSV